MPKMATRAHMPASKTLPLTAVCTLALLTVRMSAAVDIITISMVSGMVTRCSSPSIMNAGRMVGMLPKSTTSATPVRNASTAYLALGSGFFIISSIRRMSCSGRISPWRTRSQ